MKPKSTLRSYLFLAGSSLLAISSAHAQSTYTWANSNITATPASPLDWLTGGPNTQGTWTGGTPVSGNLNTIQFFDDTTTNLTHTGNPSSQTSNLNNGGAAFQLGTLTLSGRASATNNAKLNLTISGDPLNFSAATGTINLDALNVDADQLITYNLNSAIQLGTASSAGALTLTGNGTSAFNIGGIISELQTGGGSLIKSGTSTVSLNGVNSYTGTTAIDAGTLQIGAAGSLGSGNYAGNISIANNAVLNFGNGVSQTLGGDILNNGTLAFSGSGGVGTYLVSGDISGSGSVNYNASINNANGTLTLSGNNTYTGKTSFGPGNIISTITLSVSSFDYITSGSYANHGLGSSLGAPTTEANGTILIGVLNNGSKSASATLKYTGPAETTDRVLSFAFSQVNAQRTIDASGSGLLKFTSPFTYTSGPSANNFPAITLSGTGLGEMAAGITNLYTAGGLGLPVTKSGAGTWTLSGSNSYTGATTITQGTLQVSDLATPGSSSSVGASTGVGGLVLNGGTLRYTGASASTTRNFALIGSGTIDASGTGALNFSPAVVSPDQNLSANFATGQKVVNGLSSTADLVVGMRVLGAGVNSTIASIDSSTQITLAGNTTGVGSATPLAFGYTATARTLTLAGTNTDANTIAGILQNTSAAGAGVLNLAKSGVGTWVLGGANTYTGSTTLSAGTLLVNGSLASGSAVTVNGGDLGGTGTIGGSVTVNAAGSVAPATVGTADTLAITGNLTLTNQVNGGAGKLKFDLASIAASDKINVTGDLTIGTAFLNLADFQFNTLTGLQNGTYPLIACTGTLSGTLAGSGLTGTGNITGPGGTGDATLEIDTVNKVVQLVVSNVSGGGDVTAPTLTSIADNVGGGPVTEDASVTYTVTFNEDIDDTTVTTGDFNNEGTAALTINSVVETGPNTGIFTVVASPTTPGTLKLRIPTGAVIADTSTNPLVVPVSDDTTITVKSKYEAWSGALDFDTDTNGDGVKNGLAFLLGAANKTDSALGLLPTVTQSGGNLILTFNMLNAANRKSASIQVQQSRDLGISDAWVESAVVPDVGGLSPSVNGVTFNVTLGSPTNAVVATVAASEALPGTKLFGRLKANQ